VNNAHVHGPLSEKACDACHGIDVGGHRFPLKREGNANCTFCHAVEKTASHQHKPLQDGCITCHEPHSSPTKFLLKADNVEQLCLKCHKVELKKFAHDPFAKGQCTLCHEPHQSNFVKLLRGGNGKDHCYSCHTNMQQAATHASMVHKPVLDGCTTCHNPHTSENPKILKASIEQTCLTAGCHDKIGAAIAAAPVKHSAVSTANACANCHDPHFSNEPHLLAGRTDALCMTCHDRDVKTKDGRTVASMKETLTKSEFLHGPIRAGNCSACHDPHGAEHGALLSRAFPQSFYTRFDIKKYDLCFTCHQPDLVLTDKTVNLTNFRDGEKNLHFVHVNRDEKGRSCKSCHDIHGSNLPNHIASEVKFEGSKWAMSMDYRKSETGGTCTPMCHKTKSYDRGGPARKFPTTTRGAS
jgi:predicted CXXCH cytochrome family protein